MSCYSKMLADEPNSSDEEGKKKISQEKPKNLAKQAAERKFFLNLLKQQTLQTLLLHLRDNKIKIKQTTFLFIDKQRVSNRCIRILLQQVRGNRGNSSCITGLDTGEPAVAVAVVGDQVHGKDQ
jgi:hypothetical protein